MVIRLLLFLVLNFGALAIGGFFAGSGAISEWYAGLNKAPWTPPGWMFGATWTTIMICFSFYMAYAVKYTKHLRLLIVCFVLQWLLNIGWNPAFFYLHEVLAGFIIITALTIVVLYILSRFRSEMQLKTIFILPYAIWLIIATSLNAYILIYN